MDYSLSVVVVVLLSIITLCVLIFTLTFVLAGARLMRTIRELKKINKRVEVFKLFLKKLILKL